jgi:hypothetical protein
MDKGSTGEATMSEQNRAIGRPFVEGMFVGASAEAGSLVSDGRAAPPA